VVMLCVPGQPMLVYVDDEELSQRSGRRAPRPASGSGLGDPCPDFVGHGR
jgi:hypothetical protein